MNNCLKRQLTVTHIFCVLILLLTVVSNAEAQTCVSPPPGLVSWWPGDGNPIDIQDGNDGTLLNGATFAAGQVDNAFSLDGVDDFIDVPDADNLDLTNEITIDAWIKTNNASIEQMVVSKVVPFGGNPGVNYYFEIFQSKLTFAVTGNAWQQGDTLLSSNSWYHVAVTYDGSDVRFYLNGNPDGTRGLTNPPVVANNANLNIGRQSVEGGHYFDGFLDEVEIFNRALSLTEIQDIFNAGSAGKCKVISFADFTLNKAVVKFKTHPTGVNDGFKLKGNLTLGPTALGIDLPNEEVEVTVGTASMVIPAGSFTAIGPRLEFVGNISGAAVKMTIQETGLGTFNFMVAAIGVDMTDTTNPVNVTLRVGDDSGTTDVRLKGKLKLPKVRPWRSDKNILGNSLFPF